MAGEFGVSMPLVFRRDLWTHTMSASELVLVVGDDGARRVRRRGVPSELLSGVIFYADMDDKDLEKRNIELLSANKIPCWPSPALLSRMLDRHLVLLNLCQAGYVSHPVVIGFEPTRDELPPPYVLKAGLAHRGQDKFLIRDPDRDWPTELPTGLRTMEPYFEGESVRVLVIDDDMYGIRIRNDRTWIKNLPGAESERIELRDNLKAHARAVCYHLDLEVAGVDYIVEPNGAFHLLEVNHFPGLNVDDEIVARAQRFLGEIMEILERRAK
jgi:hypothetical protein